MKTKLLVKTTLGKDGKTYRNMILLFLDNFDNEIFSLPIKPSFELTSKAYSRLMFLLNDFDEKYL